MKTLYLDIFSGISGDMFLGALLDLGVDFHTLEAELSRLGLDGYHLHHHRAQKSGISGIKFDVHLGSHAGHSEPAHDHDHDHVHPGGHDHSHAPSQSVHNPSEPHPVHPAHPVHPIPDVPDLRHFHPVQPHSHSRNYQQIRDLIQTSPLSTWVKEKSTAVFQRIAIAEGQIHGVPPGQVHFHEVGAIDSIIDIVGACVALEMLGRPRVLSSRVVEGTGWVKCEHGNFPLPAPATLAILGHRGVAVTQCDEPHELVTPTGAALLAEFVEEFGPMHNLTAHRIGIGLGTRENHTRPNVLRAILSEDSVSPSPGWESDNISVLETNLDDTTPELLGSFLETAMEAGALDVFFTPIQMKKNRPAVLLSLICPVTQADQFSEMILRETSAFGVRRATLERRKLSRDFKQANTPYGEVTIKLGRLGGELVQAAPEYESCRTLAARAGVPARLVFEAAVTASHEFLAAHPHP